MKEITIEISTICGADCVMCARKEHVHHPHNMSFVVYCQLLHNIAAEGYDALVFGGMGDPVANPEMERMFAYTKENYPTISIRLTTTGQLLNPSIEKSIYEYVDILKFSHYGYTKSVYESVHRGSLCFEKIKANILRVVNNRDTKPYVVMNYLDLDLNHHEVQDWIRFWQKQNVDQLDVWEQHNWAGYEGAIMHSEQSIPCHRVLTRNIAVWVDGDVSVCCFDCEKKLLLGNLLNESFEQLYQKSLSVDLMARHKSGASLDPYICSNCDQIFNREFALLYREVKGKIIKNKGVL